MAQRTTDRVAAGKRAAKYIACDVCSERVLALFAAKADDDEIDRIFEAGSLGDWLGDVKGLCGMKGLAEIFRRRRLEVSPKPDGTCKLEKLSSGSAPFYEEINTSDLVFHWKSLAVQEACTEVFRRDGDAVAAAVEEGYKKLGRSDGQESEPMQHLNSAIRKACSRAKACKAADKLFAKAAKGTEL